MTDTTPTTPHSASDIAPARMSPSTITDFNAAPNGGNLFTAATLNPPQDLQAGGIVMTERQGDIGWQMAIVNDQPRRIFQRTWAPNDSRWRNWKTFNDQLLTTRRTDAAISAALTTARAEIEVTLEADLNRRLTAEEQARAAAIADAVNDAVNLLQQDLTDLESRQVTPARVHSIVEAELADERQSRDSAIAAATTAIASTRQAGIDAAVSAAITAERAAADRRVDDRLAPITTRLDDIADDVTAEAAARTAGIGAAKRELESTITAECTGWKQAILREGAARRTGDEAASAALAAESRARAQAITAGDNAVKAAVTADVTSRLGQVESRLNARVNDAGFPRGTRMLFQQSSAPTGWTRDTSHHDKALRVVSGAVGSGGSVGFTKLFNQMNIGARFNVPVSGRVGDHRLTVEEIPPHSHQATAWFRGGGDSDLVHEPARRHRPIQYTTDSVGGGRPHSHSAGALRAKGTASGSLNFALRYLDVMVAVKD